MERTVEGKFSLFFKSLATSMRPAYVKELEKSLTFVGIGFLQFLWKVNDDDAVYKGWHKKPCLQKYSKFNLLEGTLCSESCVKKNKMPL